MQSSEMQMLCVLTDGEVVDVHLLGSGELSTSDTELVDNRDSFSWFSSVSCDCLVTAICSVSVSDSTVLSNWEKATLSSASSVSIVSSDDRGTAEATSGSSVSVTFWVFFAASPVEGHNASTGAESGILTSVEFESSVRSITAEAELTEHLVRLIKPSRGPRPFIRAGLGCRGAEVASTSFSPSEALGSTVEGAEDAVLVLLGFPVSLGTWLSRLKGRRAGKQQNTLDSFFKKKSSF